MAAASGMLRLSIISYVLCLNWTVLIVNCGVCFCVGQEREVQKSYWIEHTAELTVEAMMLDSKAADLDKEERPEVYITL